ncbi:L-lysine 2-3-aminomutase [Penicillium vulpinum]|uniref:L-lysine 2-3-aminomutase n=1 Tax=Penicillium vulpinum TaxID=29845 RepID=UPI0025482A82|nr:L-lysine 2-3-aminomutase [Penicillium vulpinum]KAJ5951092.1 L-lysine 2-3-aminomutase [Penicillium vulpinum]
MAKQPTATAEKVQPYTYDHRVWKTGLPVRSAVLKPHAGELVVGWVTTSESSLLYVFVFFLSVQKGD